MKRIVLVILSVLCFSALACGEPRRSVGAGVLGLFAVGDFLPHIPTLADVRRELGSIRELNIAEDRFYVYRVANSGWLALRPNDASQEKYIAIEEVIYSRFPPAPAAKTQALGKRLLSSRLMGIALGDSINKFNKRRIHFSITNGKLFGHKVVVYEFAPKPGEDDLFYRYYVSDNIVEAFSIGVTE